MKKKKVCHLVDDLKIGGLERTVEKIVLFLNSLYEHKVVCLRATGEIAEKLRNKNIDIVFLNIKGKLNLKDILKLRNYLKKENIDILHCHSHYTAVWGIVSSLFLSKIYKIVHVQNLYYDLPIKEKVKEYLISYFVHRYIAVSESVKKCLTEHIKINSNKVTVVYNTAEKIEISPEIKKNVKKELGLENCIVLGTISRLVEHKGHRYVIECVSRLNKEFNIKYLIVGDGPERKNLENLVKALNLEDNVIFTGWREDIKYLLSVIDIFVLISTLREGLPLALVESLSVGIPVITTDIGGNTEVVYDNINGFIVEVNIDMIIEKIKLLATNFQLRENMGKEGKKIYEKKFVFEMFLNKIQKIYNKEI